MSEENMTDVYGRAREFLGNVIGRGRDVAGKVSPYAGNLALGAAGAAVAYDAITEERDKDEGFMKRAGRVLRASLGILTAAGSVAEVIYRNNPELQEKLRRIPYVSRPADIDLTEFSPED